ncbi:TPA: hypothetical protein DCZ39_08525 [Patescibacteria group bacterium]|nr:hypothetical protein [Candidatus Gracilibacteria bacterium]
MKKLLCILLLVNSWSLTFATTQRKVVVHGEFPIEKLSLLSSIQHDTVIFDRTEVGSLEKWESGFFFAHQYKASYLQDYNYRVECKKNLITVYESTSSEPRNVGPYFLTPLLSPWFLVSVPLILHLILFLYLRGRLFRIYRDDRSVTLRQQRKEKMTVVLIITLLALLLGFFCRSQFFILFSLVYLGFMFQTAKSYSRSGKIDGDLFIGHRWLGV